MNLIQVPSGKTQPDLHKTSTTEDEEDYIPEEVQQVHKRRKTEIRDAIEADSSLAGVDLSEALAVAEGTPDPKAKKATEDEGSLRKSMPTPANASPSTLQSSTMVEGSVEDSERQRSVTQLNDSHTADYDSDLTPLPYVDAGICNREA